MGCIPYLDSFIYFDRNGIFIEGDKTRDESVPFFDGIQVDRVVQDEKLPIEDTVLNTAVALSTIFAKNDNTPDHIQFDEKGSISLLYGDITVQLGRDQFLEDKMTPGDRYPAAAERPEGDPSSGECNGFSEDNNL